MAFAAQGRVAPTCLCLPAQRNPQPKASASNRYAHHQKQEGLRWALIRGSPRAAGPSAAPRLSRRIAQVQCQLPRLGRGQTARPSAPCRGIGEPRREAATHHPIPSRKHLVRKPSRPKQASPPRQPASGTLRRRNDREPAAVETHQSGGPSGPSNSSMKVAERSYPDRAKWRGSHTM